MDKEGGKSLAFTILAIILFICALFICLLAVFSAVRENGVVTIRAEAVEHGFGRWIPDKLGKSTFRWEDTKVRALPPDGSSGTDGPTGFHNPATAEDYEHMHDYLPQKEKPVK